MDRPSWAFGSRLVPRIGRSLRQREHREPVLGRCSEHACVSHGPHRVRRIGGRSRESFLVHGHDGLGGTLEEVAPRQRVVGTELVADADIVGRGPHRAPQVRAGHALHPFVGIGFVELGEDADAFSSGRFVEEGDPGARHAAPVDDPGQRLDQRATMLVGLAE